MSRTTVKITPNWWVELQTSCSTELCFGLNVHMSRIRETTPELPWQQNTGEYVRCSCVYSQCSQERNFVQCFLQFCSKRSFCLNIMKQPFPIQVCVCIANRRSGVKNITSKTKVLQNRRSTTHWVEESRHQKHNSQTSQIHERSTSLASFALTRCPNLP